MAPWLHISLPYAAPGTLEYDSTTLHVQARNCVERCIGVLKARWRCLCIDRALTYRPIFAGCITVACCVLHNYCIRRGVVNPRPIYENIGVVLPDFDNLPVHLLNRARAERQYLIDFCHARRQRRIELYGY
ncbi:hypothetical protein FOCC_FOCC017662 [Frankliniella occidentalis]|nr:hypothetical protein FOCC_FOCC017662 [Frankliniella occidentalis]